MTSTPSQRPLPPQPQKLASHLKPSPLQAPIPSETVKGPEVYPPSVLLMGPSGTGKTYSISTLLECGLEVFVIGTEPTYLDTLLDVVGAKGLDINKLHWQSISPARGNIKSLISMAKSVSTMGYEDLTKKKPGPERRDAQWLKVLDALNDFTDDRTGKKFGDVTEFGAETAVVIDSLSGLNVMAMDITKGDKVTAHQGEWGIAMELLDKMLLLLTSSLQSTLVVIAHIEREHNEITGGSTVGVSTLGRKLAPKIPRFFSEIVLSHREGPEFLWSTAHVGYDLKHRALPISPKIQPSFRPVVDAYRKRIALVSGRTTPAMPASTEKP